MYKRKQQKEDGNIAKKTKVEDVEAIAAGRKTQTKHINKQRTLVFSTQGIRHCDRHLMDDLRNLLPHSKKECKYDNKGTLFGVNDVCDMNNCNSCLFFEARRHSDLYLWASKTPHGPSAKFLTQNIHTMDELKLTGNCLKGSRPILSFDALFSELPQLQLMKQMLIQIFGSPRGHPKTKPFIDHVFSFYYLDGRIWFRNYQIVYDSSNSKANVDPTLVEIGPRFCLQPIKIFAGSFQGETLYSNDGYVTPTKMRSLAKEKTTNTYVDRVRSQSSYEQKMEPFRDTTDELDTVFHSDDDAQSNDDDHSDDN